MMDEEFVEPQLIQTQKIKKSGGFESMNLINTLYQSIKKKGYNIPTPIQRKSIPLIMSGHDIVACSKTGSGKTAAFLIPLINRLKQHSTIVGIRGLIIVPTRELALQTASVLKQFLKDSNLIYSLMVGGHGFEGQYESLAQNPDILIATPGRIMQHLQEGRLVLTRVEIVIYDEADILFELGLAEQLKSILSYLPKTKQSLVFSATIPEQLTLFAQAGLKDYVFVKLDKEFSLPDSLKVHFLQVSNEHKLSALVFLIQRIGLKEPIIIFASTKYLVDLICYTLDKFGIKSVNVYGKMDATDRREQLQTFKANNIKILVVTDLASRGIDIPFVGNVIQFDHPQKPKVYIHRAGRTARAGRAGTAYSLIAPEEKFFIGETMYFAGRALSNNKDDVDDNSKASFGCLPLDLIEQAQSRVDFLLKEDPEFEKLLEVQTRANEKFRKTRGQASRASKRGVEGLDFNKVHPFFGGSIGYDTEQLLEAVKTFKPQQSYLELKKVYQNKSGKSSQDESFLKSLAHIKKVEEQSKKEAEHRRKAKALRLNKKIQEDQVSNDEIDQENLNQGEVQQKQRENKSNKRSQRLDFRHPDYFISSQPDIQRKNEFDDLNKIQTTDINAYIMAEDMEGLNQKKYVWDSTKKRYVFGQKNNENVNSFKDKEDRKTADKKAKDSFAKWKKRNLLNIQNVGEKEDTIMTDRAKQMFQRRQQRGKGYYFTDMQKFKRAPNELKNSQQLIKSKKIKKNLSLKNMEKSKRRQVEQKIRSFKEDFKKKQTRKN